jgi:hypothetical protein
VVLKTLSENARHGAYWTWADTGHLASASVCRRLEILGLLKGDDGLFDGSAQTFRLNASEPAKASTRPRGEARSRKTRLGAERRTQS